MHSGKQVMTGSTTPPEQAEVLAFGTSGNIRGLRRGTWGSCLALAEIDVEFAKGQLVPWMMRMVVMPFERVSGRNTRGKFNVSIW